MLKFVSFLPNKYFDNFYNKKLNLLLIRLSSFGDVVLATSFVNALYEKYSGIVNIYFLTKKENKEILLNNKKIKKVFFVDKNINKTCKNIKSEISLDYVIDLSFTLKSFLISLCFFIFLFIVYKQFIIIRFIVLFKNFFINFFRINFIFVL